MNLIINNPYRTVGLLVGATAREQERQVKRLKQFLEAEQDPQDDFSFPTLGNLHRTLDKVNEASSKLNLDRDKMNAALFWFYKGNPITDEPAFDAIKEADLDQVISIWTKLTSNGEVSQRNASAYSNLGTLYLSGILEGTNTNEALLEQGISLKLKFLESDFIKDFKALATDETYKTTKKELQLLFLNQVQSEIEKSGGISSNKFLDILTKQEFSAKEDFLKGFVQKPIEQIEKKIEEAKAKRKANKANAVNVGKALYEQTSENLKQLKSILGTSNLKFSSISDKVSDEILQCGIDYFSHYKNSSTDPGSASMDLFRKAKTLAAGNIAKQRCSENTENLQEWIDDKPERDKQARILADFEKLKNLIDEYEGRSETVANGKQLLASAIPYLSNVKSVLGSTDELYLGLSSRIASDAQGMCVSEINKLQERFSNTYENATKLAAILLLKQRVDEAWEVTTTIGSMDLRQDFRARYNQNKTSLSNLKTQLAVVNTGGRTGGRGGGSGGGGCYIATMAYGDYDHPQVMILRKFRDEALDKSTFGKWFIKTYYHYSPKLVDRLKNQRTVNIVIRKALNQFIKLIK
ncbi:MAG: CFI-box-CTERM domain-containing protein [Chitinophagaceae bacterium]